MPLRVAYLTAIYPRATDTFIQREVAALRTHGVHVRTFSVRPPAAKEIVGPEQQEERAGTCYVLPFKPGALLASQFSTFFRSPVRYLRALKTAMTVRAPGLKSFLFHWVYFAEAAVVARRMRKENLTHLHAHFSSHPGTVAMLAAEMGRFTFSLTMHGPAEFFEPKAWRMDEKTRRALFVSCISHFCRSQAMVFAPQEKWDRLHVVHCGVDRDLFTPVRHAGTGDRLLFVGRLAGVKGLPILLQALARVKQTRPGVRLTVAGDGPDRAKLEAMARDLSLADAVRFLGYQSQGQVRDLLQQTDVFVLASFAEGVPVVLMEAMAAGVPVVSSHIAGIPELVEEGVSGFLVPPGDVAAMAEKIERLAGDAELRARLGSAGRRKVEREFNIYDEAERLWYVLTNALAGRTVPVRPEVPEAENTEKRGGDVVEPGNLPGSKALARMAS